MSMNGSSSISAHFVSKFRFHRASSIRPSALKTRRSRPGNWLVYFWHVAARWSLDFFSMYKIIESVDKLSETNGINHCQCAAKSFPQERAPATNSTSTLAPLVAWMQTWYIVRRSKRNNCLVKRQAKTTLHHVYRLQVRSCQELRVQQSSQPFACLSKTCPTHRKKTLIYFDHLGEGLSSRCMISDYHRTLLSLRSCPDCSRGSLTLEHLFVSAVKIRKGTLRLKFLKEPCGVIQIIKCQVCQVMDFSVRKERCRWGTSSGHLV